MPAAAPIIATAVVSGFASAATIGAFSWAAFAGSMILGGLSYALTPKPKSPQFAQGVGGSTVAVRQADLTRQYVYGHTRVTRGYAHMESTGVNGTLHLILMLCEGGPSGLRAINEIWVNDYCIPQDWITPEGTITEGRYAGYMTIRKHLGTPDQIADSSAVANLAGWTSEHRLQGIAYLYITMDKNQDVYPNGIPNITAIVEGSPLYDPRTNGLNWTTNLAQFSRDFLRNEKYGFGALADDIDEVNIAAQMNICDEIVDTEDKQFLTKLVAPATDLITLDEDVLELQFGDQVQVTSTGTLPGGLTALTNYYVIPYQVKTNPRIKLATSLDNAMAKIAIDITTAGSGTIRVVKTGEPRYHGSGVFDTEDNLSKILNDLTTSMAGRAVNMGGFWSLLAGAWRTPDLSLGIGDVRGSGIGYKSDLSMAESYNVVKGLYVSPVNFYQNTDYPSARYQTFIDQDNGLESPKEINLAYVNRPTQAQRIAKIELFRARQGIAFNADFSMKALQCQPGDNVGLNIDRVGWAAKPFEVTGFAFNLVEGQLSIKLELRETAQAIFDWSQGEAIEFDPAPNTNLPDIYNVQVPSGVKYNSRAITSVAGDVSFVLQLEWNLHPDAFVREYGDFEIQYKLASSPDWLPSFFVDGSLTSTDVFQSSVGINYDMRIRARNNLGVRSGWVTLNDVMVGSSGGIGATEDWETFSDPVVYTQDWGTFSDPVGSGLIEDWGYFT